MGGAQPQVQCKFKHSQVELSTASTVSISTGVLKPSQLDNELIKDQQNRLWGLSPPKHPPDLTHVIGLPRFLPLFHFCVLLSTQTEKEQGRTSNSTSLQDNLGLIQHELLQFRALPSLQADA